MKAIRVCSAILLTILLAACGKPVPAEKASYVGEWQSKTMYLLITQDGSVKYKRVNAGSTTSINAPVKDFIGNNIEVGVGPMTTIFVVSKLPYQDGEQWKMVVDDEMLIKSAN